MLTKLIVWTIATAELNEWENYKLALAITGELLLALLLIPLFMVAVCVRAMFIK